MRPLNVARREVLESLPEMGAETVDLERALGGVAAIDLISAAEVPPFANSAMDGYAVRADDIGAAPVRLRIIEDVPAGSTPEKAVGEGEATRIMTGAPVPDGADCIVMVEDTTDLGNGTVEISVAVERGTSVRKAGADVSQGDVLVNRGTRLTARHLASLASTGATPHVARRPTVAVMSTGDEVLPPDTADLPRGKIRDTNRPMIKNLLADLAVPTVDLGIVGDNPGDLREAYRTAAASADIIVSTGGVSMGDYDYVKFVLADLGSVQFWKVAMQPAKPFAFGAVDGVPLFGLPGNPVSTFVAFEQFVRPGLLSMMGASNLLRPRVVGTAGEDLSTNIEKEVFLRVLLAEDDSKFVALQSGGQGSNMLSSLAAADSFAVVPVGTDTVAAGSDVELEMFTWDENRGIDD
ncbi:MAG: molybdopterin molybdotransferase MoeA [Acidimicrobiia bacterium]